MALVGRNSDAIAVGLRNFPTQKLVLLSPEEHGVIAEELKRNYERVLKIPVEIYSLREPGVRTMLEVVGKIVEKEKQVFEDFILNVGAGDRYFTCAGTTAAFVYGIKAFDVMGDQPEMLPVLKLSYTEIISQPKMDILRALDDGGGSVESLEELSKISRFGKALLSYHIKGGEDSRGLVELGLVEAEREAKGKLRVKLTPLGKTLLLTTKS